MEAKFRKKSFVFKFEPQHWLSVKFLDKRGGQVGRGCGSQDNMNLQSLI